MLTSDSQPLTRSYRADQRASYTTFVPVNIRRSHTHLTPSVHLMSPVLTATAIARLTDIVHNTILAQCFISSPLLSSSPLSMTPICTELGETCLTTGTLAD